MVGARARQAGFTYLGLIILVAIIGMVGAATLKIGSLLQRVAAEEELLETGAAFSAALESYAAATPRGQPPQPPTLDVLLKDPRFPGVRRHLRKIFVDPMTGKAEWGVVYLGGGDKGVVAVYSLSEAKPLKIANFDSRFRNFENKEKISEWRFTANSQELVNTPRPPKPAAPAPDGAQPPAAPPVDTPPAGAPVEPEPPAQEPEPQEAPASEPAPQEPPAREAAEETPEPPPNVQFGR
ncbi:type II secretion system protein [Massilia niastensis]|uniref:type II secretion system protein n=1 Tax=Massilia niastensis TaxID=544911 RepID=UPI000382F0E4|nr:type II secretion system protein [Massilia niastensis]